MRPILILAALLVPLAASATTEDLLRAQHTDIGDVTVTDDGRTLTVDVTTDDGWALGEVHVAAGCDTGDIPTTRRDNPIPGLFPLGDTGICDDTLTYTFDLDELACDDRVVVAVHAVSLDAIDYVVGDLETVEAFDDSVRLRASAGTSSYLSLQIDGKTSYEGWCVDLDTLITVGRWYWSVEPISSYAPEADDLVDDPDNLDAVNYVLNTDWSYLGANTADIQTAIWRLIDDASTVEPGARARVYNAIVKRALGSGDGYEPDVDGVYAVLMLQDRDLDGVPEMQVLAVPVPVPVDPVCGVDAETAWADGTRFVTRGSWATYVEHGL